MKQLGIFTIVLVGTMILASSASAQQGSVIWSAGFPKTGNAGTGIIKVSATFTTDIGYNYTSSVVVYLPMSGGPVKQVNLVNNNGIISGQFTGTPGTTYVFFILMTETDPVNNDVATVGSSVKTLKAP
jgi:hypothetical protein